jgi:hypothetical protein
MFPRYEVFAQRLEHGSRPALANQIKIPIVFESQFNSTLFPDCLP